MNTLLPVGHQEVPGCGPWVPLAGCGKAPSLYRLSSPGVPDHPAQVPSGTLLSLPFLFPGLHLCSVERSWWLLGVLLGPRLPTSLWEWTLSSWAHVSRRPSGRGPWQVSWLCFSTLSCQGPCATGLFGGKVHECSRPEKHGRLGGPERWPLMPSTWFLQTLSSRDLHVSRETPGVGTTAALNRRGGHRVTLSWRGVRRSLLLPGEAWPSFGSVGGAKRGGVGGGKENLEGPHGGWRFQYSECSRVLGWALHGAAPAFLPVLPSRGPEPRLPRG